MGKKLTAAAIAAPPLPRPVVGTRRGRRIGGRFVFTLALSLVVAGCAAENGKRTDDARFGGFYGGISGGVVP